MRDRLVSAFCSGFSEKESPAERLEMRRRDAALEAPREAGEAMTSDVFWVIPERDMVLQAHLSPLLSVSAAEP